MVPVMTSWLNRFADVLLRASEEAEAVWRELERARRTRTRIELQSMNAAARQRDRKPMATNIEQLRADDLVIAQPTLGGYTRPLATGERLEMTFFTPRGRAITATRSLGRIKIPSGGRGMLYGYKLALPEQIALSERREEQRIRIAIDLAPKVELIIAGNDPARSIKAVGHDLSAGGMLVRTRRGGGALTANQPLVMRLQLPEPVGAVEEPVTVAAINPGPQEGEHLVHLRFSRPIPGLDTLLRLLELRRRKRQHAA